MLSVPESFAQIAKSITGKYSPAMFLDIYADTGPQDEINSTSRWKDVRDPAIVNDVGVDLGRKNGAVVLAAGVPLAPAPAGADVLVTTMTYTLQRTDRYHYKGLLGKAGGSSYGYDGTAYAVLTNDTARFQVFSAGHTQIIDTIDVIAAYGGTQSMPVIVRMVNIDTGNQVGGAVTFTPTATVTHHALSGFAAGIVAGRNYRIEFTATPPSVLGSKLGPPSVTIDYTCYLYLYACTPANPAWRIPFGMGTYLAIGGRPNYVASGSFMRTLDVGMIPIDTGYVSISDIVPNGTTMIIQGYYTDSAAVAANTNLVGWTYAGYVQSGLGVSMHRWWRFVVAMTASAAGDLSPELWKVAISFVPPPITVGTTAEHATVVLNDGFVLPVVLPIIWNGKNRMIQRGIKALNSISTNAAQLSPQFSGSIVGSVSAQLAPDPIVDGLLRKYLRNKRVDIRAGYTGIPETFKLYSLSAIDMSYSNLQYTLLMEDHFKLAAAKIPAKKAGNEWLTGHNYAINDLIIHGAASYTCSTAHTSSAATEPGIGASWATYWLSNGTVWATISYTAATNAGADWHLADIIKDILINHINIPYELINFDSIAAVKAIFPNRTGSRTITKPTSAQALLGELAWLLESQWIPRDGLFTLMAEPEKTALPVENIQPRDIVENSVRYRRGWKEMVNQALIVSGYTGDASSAETYGIGEAAADAASQANYDAIVQKDWKDKWNMPVSELQARDQAVLSRYANGRRVVSCGVSRRLIGLDAGDVITISSKQFPAGDAGPFTMWVLGKPMDWAAQNITLNLLEL